MDGSHRSNAYCSSLMNVIDLRRFDLNLLVVFEVLMAELSVTRAAERLGRTQSAVSHSLARLRAELGDPLLIKGLRGMQPTAFALELMEQARPILRGIQRPLSPLRPASSAPSPPGSRISQAWRRCLATRICWRLCRRSP